MDRSAFHELEIRKLNKKIEELEIENAKLKADINNCKSAEDNIELNPDYGVAKKLKKI